MLPPRLSCLLHLSKAAHRLTTAQGLALPWGKVGGTLDTSQMLGWCGISPVYC